MAGRQARHGATCAGAPAAGPQVREAAGAEGTAAQRRRMGGGRYHPHGPAGAACKAAPTRKGRAAAPANRRAQARAERGAERRSALLKLLPPRSGREWGGSPTERKKRKGRDVAPMISIT